MSTKPHYGKFRGVVSNNKDPLNRGRIRAYVPDVYGSQESGWALPCVPLAGDKMGFFAIPPIQSPVWVEFEGGDPDYPIWVGGWWEDQKNLPALPSSAQNDPGSVIMLCTKGGHSVLLDDAQSGGGITLTTSGGQKITLNSQSIEIDNGNGAKITLSSSTTSINSGALEVS